MFLIYLFLLSYLHIKFTFSVLLEHIFYLMYHKEYCNFQCIYLNLPQIVMQSLNVFIRISINKGELVRDINYGS